MEFSCITACRIRQNVAADPNPMRVRTPIVDKCATEEECRQPARSVSMQPAGARPSMLHDDDIVCHQHAARAQLFIYTKR